MEILRGKQISSGSRPGQTQALAWAGLAREKLWKLFRGRQSFYGPRPSLGLRWPGPKLVKMLPGRQMCNGPRPGHTQVLAWAGQA